MNYCLISGATGGIGKAFVYEIASRGENLILTGRSEQKLNTLKSEINLKFPSVDVMIFACDLTSESEREVAFSNLENLSVKISRLINVAGVDTQKAFFKYTQDKLVFQTRVNFEATVSLTKFALENRAEKLSVLTVSSMCAISPMPYFALYSATKRALLQFFDSLSYEYDERVVTFTTILPGSVPTRPDIVEDIKKQGLTAKLSKKSPEFIAKKSLIAADKRKRRYIPGFYNKVVYFFSKITPKKLQAKIISRKFSIKEKDAF